MRGYIGMRAFEGVVDIDDEFWTLTLHEVGAEKDCSASGKVSPINSDESQTEVEPDSSQSKPRQYLDCAFEFHDPELSGMVEATCLHEERLTIEGSSKIGSDEQPFFLGNSARPDPGEDHVVLLTTKVPAHGCAPFVEYVQSTVRANNRHAILYTLRWPCDEPVPTALPTVYLDDTHGQAEPQPDTYVAYVADISDTEPKKLLSAVPVARLGNAREEDDTQLALKVFEFLPGLELYLASATYGFQSQVTSAGNSTTSMVAWVTTSEGKYGPKFELPSVESGHVGACFQSNTLLDMWLLDIDNDKIPEFLVKTAEESYGQGVNKDGTIDCVVQPRREQYLAYRLDKKSLRWAKRAAPSRLSSKQLAKGKKLE